MFKKKTYKILWYSVYGWFVVICLVIICIGVYEVHEKYQQLVHWDKHPNVLLMSQVPPDVLLDTPEIARIKETYQKYEQTLYHTDGTYTASEKQYQQLKQYFERIPENGRQPYLARFNWLSTKASIAKTLDELFDQHHHVVKTPDDVSHVMTQLVPKLDGLYEQDTHDKFVLQTMKTLDTLGKDALIVSQYVTDYRTHIPLENHQLRPLTDFKTTDYEAMAHPLKDLTYQWAVLRPMLTLEPALSDILSKQDQIIHTYEEYRADLVKRDQAYADWQASRVDHKNRYLRQEADKALAAQRAKEREEQAKRDAQAQKDREQAERKRHEDESKASSSSPSSSSSSSESSKQDTSLTVPDDVGKNEEVLSQWATAHNIQLVRNYVDSDKPHGTILSITGADDQNKIKPNGTLTITIAN